MRLTPPLEASRVATSVCSQDAERQAALSALDQFLTEWIQRYES